MPVSIFDLVIVGVMLISALLAMLRGFTREVLAIASWGAAAVAAYLFYPLVVPHVKGYLPSANPALVNGLSAGGVFLVTLIVAYIVTSKLSDLILDSRIGALDRTLGFVFGAARGFLLMVVAYGFFTFLIGGNKMPDQIAGSQLRPYLETASQTLMALLPADLSEQFSSALKKTGVAPGTNGQPAAQ